MLLTIDSSGFATSSTASGAFMPGAATRMSTIGTLICGSSSGRTAVSLSIWPLMNAYRNIFIHDQWPDWATLWFPGLLSLGLLLAGFVVFKRLQNEILDEV